MAWVLAPTNKLQLTVTDRAGKRATVGFWIDAGQTDPMASAAETLGDAVQGVSDGGVTRREILRYAVQDAPAAVPANTFRGTDKVRIRFADANGVKGSLELGAIKPAYLEADGVTLLAPGGSGPAAAVTALQNALKAAGATAENGAITTFFSARRLRNPGIKKQ